MYHIFKSATRNLTVVKMVKNFSGNNRDENGGAVMHIILQPPAKRLVLNILLTAVILAALPAQGMIYMWRDSAGIAHYTNKEYDVPARYKIKVKVLYPDASDAGSVPSGNAAVQAAPFVQPPDVRSVASPAQVVNTPSKAPERRARRPRERNSDDE